MSMLVPAEVLTSVEGPTTPHLFMSVSAEVFTNVEDPTTPHLSTQVSAEMLTSVATSVFFSSKVPTLDPDSYFKFFFQRPDPTRQGTVPTTAGYQFPCSKKVSLLTKYFKRSYISLRFLEISEGFLEVK
jgi:hypothetical protein